MSIDETGYPPTPGIQATAKRVIAAHKAAQELTDRLRAQSRVTVYTLTIDHRHGTDVRVFRTEEGAQAALAAWCRQWWPTETKGMDDAKLWEGFDTLSDNKAIETYFGMMEDRMGDGETYALNSATLED